MDSSNSLTTAVLLAYVLFGAGIVITLRGIKGVLAAIIVGWMFLPPIAGVNLPGLPAFSKIDSVVYAALLGALISEAKAITSFRFKLLDIPIAVWILVPFFSSYTNGLGISDGFSELYIRIVSWGIPYFLGRVFIQSPKDVRTAALSVVVAGLIATPLALWEVRMSPQLHRMVYGTTATQFIMTMRLGGYRPLLFMRHGLEVGLWMSTASAAALWLTIAGRDTLRVMGFRLAGISGLLFVTTVLCKSLGALILLAGVTSAALLVRAFGIRFIFVALLLAPAGYITLSLTDTLPREMLADVIAVYDDERASSFSSRLKQEQIINDHAMQRPLVGWGGFNRYRPINEQGETDAIDSLTMITMGKNGLVGLISLLAFNLLASLTIILRLKGKEMARPFWAPTIAIMLGVTIYSLDSLFNAFVTPLHIVGLGMLASIAVLVPSWQAELRKNRPPNRKISSNQNNSSPPNTPEPKANP